MVTVGVYCIQCRPLKVTHNLLLQIAFQGEACAARLHYSIETSRYASQYCELWDHGTFVKVALVFEPWRTNQNDRDIHLHWHSDRLYGANPNRLHLSRK